MPQSSKKSKWPSLPAGFVDAMGLDDAAFPFKPYVVKPKPSAAPKGQDKPARKAG